MLGRVVAVKVMAEQMVEYVLPQESSRQRRDIEVHFTGARFIEMQAGQRRLADKSAGIAAAPPVSAP